jgi:hypothetical protein
MKPPRSNFRTRSFEPFVRPRARLTLTQLENRLPPAFLGGVNVAVGDVNGDGFPDMLTGPGPGMTPLVRVINGLDGTEALTFLAYDESFQGGVYVAAGDVDGDGTDEIITGTGNGGGPHVRVFDGKTGVERTGFFPYESSFRGGVIVAAADTTGDGKAEIITGTGVGGGPRVQVLDASTRATLVNFFAYENTFRGGVLVGAGDVDGDGQAEIVTGTGVGGGPRVQVFDAATQAPLANFFAYENTFRGGVLVGAGDTDGDGKAEIITGTGPRGGPVVTVFEAGSTESIARFFAYDTDFRGGVRVTAVDITGDGKAEIITGPGPGIESVVKTFSPDGSSLLLEYTAYDPVRLPDGPFSGPPGLSPFDYIAPVGLAVSQDRAMVGASEQIIFTAQAGGESIPSRVQLYEADSAGNRGDYLLDLFDDGDFTHRDADAGDAIFSNTFTVNYPTAGDRYYLAELTVGGAVLTSLARLTAFPQPSQSVIADRITFSDQYQNRLNGLIADGQSLENALDQVAVEVRAATGTVVAESVSVSGRGVCWMTVDGFGQGVTAPQPGELCASDGDDIGESFVSPPPQAAAISTEACNGKALVLSPYHWEFPADPSATLAGMFRSEGYTVTARFNLSQTDQTVKVADFKNLGRYDAVVLWTHGEQTAGTRDTALILTGEEVTVDSFFFDYSEDILAGRITTVTGKDKKTVYALTPLFFQYYTGQMDGTVVYFGACRSARNSANLGGRLPELPLVFRSLGASAFAGYSDYVQQGFAGVQAVKMFEHLLQDGSLESIPQIGAVETDADPARFRVFGNPDSTLVPKCDLLIDYNLSVTYTWPDNQKDLDSGTLFLGEAVGYACGSSKYLSFSGDDTGTGGKETVIVDIASAHFDDRWDTQVPVTLRAGWYTPAGGSGPATVTVALKHKTTGQLRRAIQRSIAPGQQTGCATTVVGTVYVNTTDPLVPGEVDFTLS